MENLEDITKEIFEEEERKRKKLLEQMKRAEEMRKKQLAEAQKEIEEKTSEILTQLPQSNSEVINPDVLLNDQSPLNSELPTKRKAEIEKEIELLEQEIDSELALGGDDLEPTSPLLEGEDDRRPGEVEEIEEVIPELQVKIEQQFNELKRDIEVEEGVLDENIELLNSGNDTDDEIDKKVESQPVSNSEDLETDRANLENPEQESQITKAKKKVQKRESGNNEPKMTPGKTSELLEVARSENKNSSPGRGALSETMGGEGGHENIETDDIPTFIDLLTKPATNEKLYDEDEVIDEPTVEEIMRERFTANGTPDGRTNEELKMKNEKIKEKREKFEDFEQQKSSGSESQKEIVDRKKKIEDVRKDSIQSDSEKQSSSPERDTLSGTKSEEGKPEIIIDERIEQLDKGTQGKIKEEGKKIKDNNSYNNDSEQNISSPGGRGTLSETKSGEGKEQNIYESKSVSSKKDLSEKLATAAANSGEMPKDYLTKKDLIKEFEKREKKEDGSVQEFGIIYWLLLYIPIFIVIFSIIMCVVFKQENFICRFIEDVLGSLLGIFGL